MSSLTLKSYSKINFHLGVLGKTKSSFHKIESLVLFPNMFDIIKIKEISKNEHKIFFYGKFSKNLIRKNSVKHLVEKKELWNNLVGFEENFESKKLDDAHRKFFGDSQNLILPNSVSGLFDIPEETLRYAKIFNIQKLINILLKGFATGKLNEIKNTKSVSLINEVVSKDDFDIFGELEKQFYGEKGEVLGTYKSDVTVEE